MSSNTPLGIGGFTFADLHQPARLRDLYNRFVEQVKAAEPELWSQWAQYREVPESLTPIARGNIVVAMAPHVSRFVAELFSVGPDVEALKAATRAYDVLFRFKIDFVRRRALPLLKTGAHVDATADDHAYVARILHGDVATEARSAKVDHDEEMRLAAYGCSLLDREATDKAAVTPEIESLKRWCAAHLHDARYRGWVVFRFPENLDYEHLVHVQRPDPGLPRRWLGPTTSCAAAKASSSPTTATTAART
jgi:hypothetical protein